MVHSHCAPLSAVLLLLLVGCRGDPAAEAPVMMVPGLYEVQMPGLSLGGIGLPDSEAGKKLCLRAGDGEYFPQRIVRESLATTGCGDPSNERAGNQLTTTIRCEFDERKISGDWYLRGRGRIDEDAFTADFKFDLTELEIDDPDANRGAQAVQAMQGVGSLRISAKRVGDCPA